MEATELRITLALDRNTWSLTLRAESDVIGYSETKPAPLPFSEADLALIERALDLNGSASLERIFSAEDRERLAALELLRRPVNPDSEQDAHIVLSGRDLHRERLRAQVRNWLVEILLTPLAGEIDQHFVAIRADAPGEHPVLYLRAQMRPELDLPLLRLPWELLHAERLTKGDIHIGRYLLYDAVPGLPEPAELLRILLLESDPIDDDLPRLKLTEHEQIAAGLAGSAHGERLRLQPITPAGYRQLLDALQAEPREPTIVHFAGHGDFGWRCEQCRRVAPGRVGSPCGDDGCGFRRHGPPRGWLAFTTPAAGDSPEFGGVHWVSIDGLRNALKWADVRLVVLNACKSAAGRGGEDVFNGMAQQLMDIVPAVIATPFPLETGAAEQFARLLYKFLGQGLPLAHALHRVQQDMTEPYPDEWYRPVLYLRSRQGDGGWLLSKGAAGNVPETVGESRDKTRQALKPDEVRRRALQQKLSLLQKQQEAALQQSALIIDAAARVQSEQQAEDLDRRIRDIVRELRGEG